MKVLALVSSSLLLGSIGCADVRVLKVDPSDKKTQEGVHFYRPHPYLLVTDVAAAPPAAGGAAAAATKDTYKYEIIWLPNFKDEWTVQTRQGLGTAKGEVKLANGWMLESLNAETDSKIPETITAATGLLTSIAGAINPAAGAAAGKQAVGPGLYKLLFDEYGFVHGLQAVNLTPR